MSIKRLFSRGLMQEEIVAVFGAARLVKGADGRHALMGGSRADHLAAREWCSLFEHEIVFSGRPMEWEATAFAE
jgi:hypothetical protein